MKRKSPRPVAPVAVDPNAEVFVVDDRIAVKRPNLWSGYVGVVDMVNGGECLCKIWRDNNGIGVPTHFYANIHAAELKKL